MDQMDIKQNSQVKVIVGSWNPSLILKIYPIWGIYVVYSNIYLATTKGETGPFPKASISECSDFYPQNLQFRLAYLPQAIFYCYVVYIFYKYANCLASYLNYKKVSKCYLYLAYGSQFFLSTAAGTVEQNGQEDDPWHSDTAVFAFLFIVSYMIAVTKGLYRLKKYSPQYFSTWSLVSKIVLITLILAVAVIEVINEIIKHLSTNLKMDPPIVVVEILGMTFMNLFFVTMGFDMDKLGFMMQFEPQAEDESSICIINQDQLVL